MTAQPTTRIATPRSGPPAPAYGAPVAGLPPVPQHGPAVWSSTTPFSPSPAPPRRSVGHTVLVDAPATPLAGTAASRTDPTDSAGINVTVGADGNPAYSFV